MVISNKQDRNTAKITGNKIESQDMDMSDVRMNLAGRILNGKTTFFPLTRRTRLRHECGAGTF